VDVTYRPECGPPDPAGQVAKALMALRASPLTKNKNGDMPILSAAYAGHKGLYDSMIRIVELMKVENKS
jgi:hypothetical protein